MLLQKRKKPAELLLKLDGAPSDCWAFKLQCEHLFFNRLCSVATVMIVI